MIIELIKNSEKVTGISIDTETYYLQNYNENSFSVTDNDSNLLSFLIEIISPTKLNIIFDNEVVANSFDFKYVLYDELGTKIEDIKNFVLVETPVDPTEPTDPETQTEPTDPETPTDPTTPTDPVDPVEPTDPETPTDPVEPTDPETPTEPTEPTYPETPTEPTDPETPTDPDTPVEPTDPETPTEPTEPEEPEGTGNTSVTDESGIKSIIMSFSETLNFIHRNLNPDLSIIRIKKFCLENYDDFAEEEIAAFVLKNSCEYKFEKNFIYEVSVENDGIIVKDKFIKGKPTAYFSSIKNLKTMSDKFALKLTGTDQENFDLKLKIWQESKNALSFAGVNGVEVTNNDIGILNKYVTYKIFAFLLAKNLIDSSYQTTLSDIETNVSSSASKLKLDVLEVSGSSSSGSGGSDDTSDLFSKINTALDEVNKEIEKIEYLIRKNFSLVFSKKVQNGFV